MRVVHLVFSCYGARVVPAAHTVAALDEARRFVRAFHGSDEGRLSLILDSGCGAAYTTPCVLILCTNFIALGPVGLVCLCLCYV